MTKFSEFSVHQNIGKNGGAEPPPGERFSSRKGRNGLRLRRDLVQIDPRGKILNLQRTRWANSYNFDACFDENRSQTNHKNIINLLVIPNNS